METLPSKEHTVIVNKIYEVRGKQVMLDFDLAQMYHVETRRLKEQVRRNIDRFPDDFMFTLTKIEWDELVAICDQLSKNIKHSSVLPFAFTQEGVAMLSGVLRSPIAIEVNITIMRAFVAIRTHLLQFATTRTIQERMRSLEWANKELQRDMKNLSHDTKKAFDDLFSAFSQLSNKINEESTPRRHIGFK
ncbi:hypothetical protein FACS189452_07680 [Bacteroidia bacterium]|nr:hypothetical protein FACS189452_07680 [Bacteroidia bacterium]